MAFDNGIRDKIMIQFPNIDPVIISFGPLAVTWYSTAYVVGILIGWQYALKLIKFYDKDITQHHIDDFISWIIIGIIIGGRLGYVLFYDPGKYFANPISILKTYEGGMSFHGGIIGYVTACYLFSLYKGVNFLILTDISAAAAPITLFLGRIANFINAELYGRVTDMPWAVIFPYSDKLPRHPSQLYESFLEGICIFLIISYLIYYRNILRKKGLTSGVFLILYAIFRIFVEFFREPDAQIGYIAQYFTMGQILCFPMLIIGIIFIFRSK